MICPKVPGTGIIPSGECLGDPVVLWVRGLSCFFAFELEARLVFVHFDTTTRCEVTGWCCDQPRHFIGAPSEKRELEGHPNELTKKGTRPRESPARPRAIFILPRQHRREP